MQKLTSEQLRWAIEDKLAAKFSVKPENATDSDVFQACAMVLREIMSRRRTAVQEKYGNRRVHYLSMEFLMGRSLMKNAFNLGIGNELAEAVEALGKNASDIFEAEPDAGLGNGGLGRLAACYMDSMATLNIPATGYSILYELGIFRQKIENGGQTERADNWHESAESWLVPDWSDTVEVHFGGHVEQNWDYFGVCHPTLKDYTTVLAVPRDMLISGYGTDKVNSLRLWEAHSPNSLDMFLFSHGEYVKSMEQRTMAEVITKVLYPADDHIEGKTLRIKQQYFFVSATAQCIVRQHRREFGDVRSFAQHHVIHINDTHPTLIIPELMRIFMDEDGLRWDEAWSIVCECIDYTNHTIMSEALECWPQGLIQAQIPRVWEIICEINLRRQRELNEKFGGDEEKIRRNLIIHDGQVHMANMCLAACAHVNGVSGLHGEILKTQLFRDACSITPDRFSSITNGIDHRRWLAQCNPGLHSLICELLGSDAYLTEPQMLSELLKYQSDAGVLARLEEVKRGNKARFAAFAAKMQGAVIDPDAILDVQVKRLHEYKRQLLCAMLITHLQNQLRENPGMDFAPRTFVFGAKAASGYAVAKRIIRLLCSLAADIEADPACKGKLRVMFLENYRVSAAEVLMPAAQISEQISTAGKEASGTGNMKLMMNGANTIGTLDGANVEMYERLGDEHMFLFGLRADEVLKLKAGGYVPSDFVKGDADLMRVLDRFSQGFADGESYADLVSRLTYGGDEYMLLADFRSYIDRSADLYRLMGDTTERSRVSLVNIAQSGIFAADRAVQEYADRIWHI